MINNPTTTGPPSTSSRRTTFLACFGFSGKKTQLKDHKVNSGSRRHRWVSQWNFSCKKSVNVDFNTVVKKSKSVNDIPVKKSGTWEIQVVDEDTTLTKKHVIMVTSDEQKTCRRKWIDVVKRQNGSFRVGRKETKLATVATSATGDSLESPETKTVIVSKPLVSSPAKVLTQSKSLPPPVVVSKRQKPTKVSLAGGGFDKEVARKKTLSGGEFDSIIAMSILLVILLIMVLWGKVCAIICTCAWFSIAPRLAGVGERAAMATVERRRPELENKMSLESVEYKKKVVLEGLLKRDHRSVVGRL